MALMTVFGALTLACTAILVMEPDPLMRGLVGLLVLCLGVVLALSAMVGGAAVRSRVVDREDGVRVVRTRYPSWCGGLVLACFRLACLTPATPSPEFGVTDFVVGPLREG